MHITSLENAKRFFDVYAKDLSQGTVVDIGSKDFNGSIRSVCPGHLKYIGVDFDPGPGVDVVIDDPYKLPFEDGSADVVVSNSTLEHSEFFWLLFMEVIRILKPTGLFYLNVPSNGPFHRYPVDCWRFYPDSGRALAAWARKNGYRTELLESYTSEQHLDVFNDYVAVFLKDSTQAKLYPGRIIHTTDIYTNGMSLGESQVYRKTNYPEDQRRIGYFVKRNLWKLWRRWKAL